MDDLGLCLGGALAWTEDEVLDTGGRAAGLSGVQRRAALGRRGVRTVVDGDDAAGADDRESVVSGDQLRPMYDARATNYDS